MQSPTIPAFPPLIEIGFVLLVELLFGFGYNFFIAWAQGRKLWHVSTSVVIGVFMTVAIKTAVWPLRCLNGWQDGLLLFGCFAASGLPMVLFSLKRTVSSSHKRMRWPTAARRAREDAIAEVDVIIEDIQVAAEKSQVTVGFLLGVVNRLHFVKGTLNSV